MKENPSKKIRWRVRGLVMIIFG